MSRGRIDLSDYPCPYCWASIGEPCSNGCVQYPVALVGERVIADPKTLQREGVDYDSLEELRAGRTDPQQ